MNKEEALKRLARLQNEVQVLKKENVDEQRRRTRSYLLQDTRWWFEFHPELNPDDFSDDELNDLSTELDQEDVDE